MCVFVNREGKEAKLKNERLKQAWQLNKPFSNTYLYDFEPETCSLDSQSSSINILTNNFWRYDTKDLLKYNLLTKSDSLRSLIPFSAYNNFD